MTLFFSSTLLNRKPVAKVSKNITKHSILLFRLCRFKAKFEKLIRLLRNLPPLVGISFIKIQTAIIYSKYLYFMEYQLSEPVCDYSI